MKELLVIALLIVLNGVLALSEIALISARKPHLATQAKRGSRSAKRALALAMEPDKFLSTIQIGITVIGILTGIYSGAVLSHDFTQRLISWGMPLDYALWVAQGVIVVGVTYLTLVFGELVPKRIGMNVAEGAAKLVARPMYWLSVVAAPFVWLLAKSTAGVFTLFGFRVNQSPVTEVEIKSLVEEGMKGGEVQEVEQDIVERVFLLGDLKISSLMTHRSEVVALELHMTKAEIRAVVHAHMYNIYPVMDHNFQHIQGVVRLKELFFQLERPDFSLAALVSPAYYFYEHMSVYKVLEQMKEQRISQALVYDEFGSFQGVITLKDIFEGLVGSIERAHEEPNIVQCPDRQEWLVGGQCPLHDFLSYFQSEELYATDTDYNTLGGLILSVLGRIPQGGARVEWHDFVLEVVDMDGVRIDKILVRRVAAQQPLGTEG